MKTARAFQGRFLGLGLSVAMIGVLILVLMPKIERDLDQLEQKRFDFRLAEIQTAVQFKELELLARSKLKASIRLVGANPMLWMKGQVEDKPAHYLGEMPLAQASSQPGSWFFDPEARTLVYLPRERVEFEGREYSSDQALHFKVVALARGDAIEALDFSFYGVTELKK